MKGVSKVLLLKHPFIMKALSSNFVAFTVEKANCHCFFVEIAYYF